jgi:hypothetical protein
VHNNATSGKPCNWTNVEHPDRNGLTFNSSNSSSGARQRALLRALAPAGPIRLSVSLNSRNEHVPVCAKQANRNTLPRPGCLWSRRAQHDATRKKKKRSSERHRECYLASSAVQPHDAPSRTDMDSAMQRAPSSPMRSCDKFRVRKTHGWRINRGSHSADSNRLTFRFIAGSAHALWWDANREFLDKFKNCNEFNFPSAFCKDKMCCPSNINTSRSMEVIERLICGQTLNPRLRQTAREWS